jgi:hypothetical protein
MFIFIFSLPATCLAYLILLILPTCMRSTTFILSLQSALIYSYFQISSSGLRSSTVCTFCLHHYKAVKLWIRVCLSESELEDKFYIVALRVMVPCSLVARYQRLSGKYPENEVRSDSPLRWYPPTVPLPRRQPWKPQILCVCTFFSSPKLPDQLRGLSTGEPFPGGKAAGPWSSTVTTMQRQD